MAASSTKCNWWDSTGLALLETALLAASLGLNATLLHRSGTTAALSAPGVRVGSVVPVLTAKRCGGGEESLQLRGARPTILYWFQPDCDWCRRNGGNLDVLFKSRSSRYRFLGLTYADPKACSQEGGYYPPFPWLGGVGTATTQALGLSGTPELLVVGADGRIKRAWLGALLGPSLTQAQAFFQLKLPGLSPE